MSSDWQKPARGVPAVRSAAPPPNPADRTAPTDDAEYIHVDDDGEPWVITTKTADAYHRDRECPGWRGGRHGQHGYRVADEIVLPLEWAVALDRIRRCTRCKP